MLERDGDVIIRDAQDNRMFLKDLDLTHFDAGDFIF
jgi:hypothetical protein